MIAVREPQFDEVRKINAAGEEFWFARELMPLLGYKDWRNFEKVVQKAFTTIQNVYPHPEDHIVEINKMVKVGAGSTETQRQVKDYKLTRYACYIIAQNGDGGKPEIAYAQTYFATQTRKQEIAQQFAKASERIRARERLKETEKKFSNLLQVHGVKKNELGEIRSSGDEVLFNMTTRQMKNKLGVPQEKPLADHLPTIAIKAKELAMEMTTFNTNSKRLYGKHPIKSEHNHNNSEVRRLLTDNGIFLEKIAAEEDVDKLKLKLTDEELDDIENEVVPMPVELTLNIIGVINQQELQRIAEVIKTNPGLSKLHIIYGERTKPRQIERSVQISPQLVQLLREYIVLAE